jgi:4-hydroxy-tetrahydrodipicolinate synthase
LKKENNMKNRFEGMIPPMVVPFDVQGEIDEQAFRMEARFLMNEGIDGISVGGSTGEGALLSDAELRKCMELLAEENQRELPVFAGIIRNSTRDVIRASKDAKEIGADVLLITPVFYHGATEDGNYEFFREIARAISLPIVIYNVVATNIISPESFMRLSEIDEVIGIKQVDPVKLAEIAVIADTETLIYSACDQMLYGTYVSGACGSISALVTVAPKLCVDQWNAYKAGDQVTAMSLQRKLVPIVRSYLEPPYPGKVKELLNLQGRQVGVGRMPNTMPTAQRKDEMRAALNNAGLLH